MRTIIPLPGRVAYPDLDAEARRRSERLSRATAQEMRTALAFLSVIDDEAFEIAFGAVRPDPDALPDPGALPDLDEPEPLCDRCGTPAALFPDQGLTWQHYRTPAGTPAEPVVIDKGHQPHVSWYLPDEAPDVVI